MAATRGRRRLITLAALILACVTLLTIAGPIRRPVSTVVRGVATPFVAVVRGVTRPIGNAMAGVFNYGNVVAQNHTLQLQIGRLQQQVAAQQYQTQQLADLLALKRLAFVGSLATVTAQSTSRDQSNFSSTITINKGSDDGLMVGMPVVAGGGLVGSIGSVTAHGATVTLVDDGSMSVGVRFGAKGYLATVQGQGAGKPLEADFVAPGTPVSAGETMYTAGLQSGQYPPGIPVGVVVTSSAVKGQTSISVDPAADLTSLAYVDVVLWEPGS